MDVLHTLQLLQNQALCIILRNELLGHCGIKSEYYYYYD